MRRLVWRLTAAAAPLLTLARADAQAVSADAQAVSGRAAASAPGNPPLPAAAAPAAAAPQPTQPASPGAAADYDAQRQQVWNSPAMVEAREFIRQYSRRSVQFGPRQAEQYLARLEQMSPSEQTAWLERFKARRAQVARGAAVARLARQQSVGHALDRLEARRQAQANISQGQTVAAEATRDRLHAQQALAGQSVALKQLGRDVTLDRIFAQAFNPFAPTLDPASPDAYTRYAAAASLPGDLVDANGNNLRGTDADVAAATPEGAAAYGPGGVPGEGGLSPGAGVAGDSGGASPGGGGQGAP